MYTNPYKYKAHKKLIDPVNLLESVPPKVSSPLVSDKEDVGAKDTETKLDGMAPCVKRLFVTTISGFSNAPCQHR